MEGGEEMKKSKNRVTNTQSSRKNVFYLHGTAAELIVQLSAEDRRGPDFILAGVHALPGDTQTQGNSHVGLHCFIIIPSQ